MMDELDARIRELEAERDRLKGQLCEWCAQGAPRDELVSDKHRIPSHSGHGWEYLACGLFRSPGARIAELEAERDALRMQQALKNTEGVRRKLAESESGPNCKYCGRDLVYCNCGATGPCANLESENAALRKALEDAPHAYNLLGHEVKVGDVLKVPGRNHTRRVVSEVCEDGLVRVYGDPDHKYATERLVPEPDPDARQLTRQVWSPQINFQHATDIDREDYTRRIAELEAERDALQARVAHLDKLADLYPISLGNACEDRDKLKHSDRALRKENAALRKALEDAPHDAEKCRSVLYRMGGMGEEDFVPENGPCTCWKADIPQPTDQTLEQSLPDGKRAGNT